ncbi:MAG: LytTR family DNA-binding domain-containing protein [Polaribacter sp.]
MKKYSILIVDDDATSIHIIKKILSSQFTDIESIHTAKSVNQGLEKYSLIKPDILLLDINLGNDTIFSLLEVIAPSESEVILISSHKDFAVEAVDHNIAAYVLKPVETSDLKKGILKAMGKIVKKEAALKNKLDSLEPEYPKRIAVQGIKEVELFSIQSIVYLEADGKYTVLHTDDNKKRLTSRNIGSFEKELNPNKFFRTHNKFIVNIDKILKINKTNMSCMLTNQKKVLIAKRRIDSFYQFLKLV